MSEMADAKRVFNHCFRFQELSDEVDVTITDFESVRNQGYRLIDLLDDIDEGNALRDRICSLQDSLDRIQALVTQKEKEVGDRYYKTAEFEVALQDAKERIDDYKTRIVKVKSRDCTDRHEKLQVCGFMISYCTIVYYYVLKLVSYHSANSLKFVLCWQQVSCSHLLFFGVK